MLWKKESKTLYINYFDTLKQSLADLDAIANQSMPPAKSNEISRHLRNEGNVEFEAKDWTNAILAWNYALCFAEPKSDALAQAYANRAASYFELDRFNSSYSDIMLALQVPPRTIALEKQLKQHRMDCMDFIEKTNSSNSSSESINNMPWSSPHLLQPNPDLNGNEPTQWLTFEQYEPLRYRFTARTDIDIPGQVIWTETALVSTLMSNQHIHCNVCFAKNDNLIPCDTCTTAMFCSSTCQYSILHMGQCKLNQKINEDGKLQLLIRTVLFAISLFNDIDNLVEFVSETFSNDSKNHVQPVALDELAKYRQFLRLKSCQSIASGDQPDALIYFAFKAIMGSKIGELFSTVKRQRFLTHLIWQHEAIISVGYVHQHTNKHNQIQSLGVFPQFSYFKHSCTPNAMYYLKGNKLIMVSLTPIKKDEEIFVSYFGKTAILIFECNRDERKERLLSLYKSLGQKCVCALCQKHPSNPKERKKMKNDQMYRHITRICPSSEDGIWSLKPSLTAQQLSDARKQAIEFLQKYGRMTWCKEMAKIVACFMDIIWLESGSDDDLNAAIV